MESIRLDEEHASKACSGTASVGGSSPSLSAIPPRSSLEWTPPCHGGDRGFKSHRRCHAGVAQLAERRVANAEAASSRLATCTGRNGRRRPKHPAKVSGVTAAWVRVPLLPLEGIRMVRKPLGRRPGVTALGVRIPCPPLARVRCHWLHVWLPPRRTEFDSPYPHYSG